ncbi:8232_t:CDS:2 [Racocetra fulgida]|uniref:8232_t:CDS:1 n=1 Tax=Racocetra fulgida TaxID=60492 RepID=A0A9N9FJV8_9GLOM|nr:8232_t:CDS:2 [Racocetra fulgida]
MNPIHIKIGVAIGGFVLIQLYSYFSQKEDSLEKFEVHLKRVKKLFDKVNNSEQETNEVKIDELIVDINQIEIGIRQIMFLKLLQEENGQIQVEIERVQQKINQVQENKKKIKNYYKIFYQIYQKGSIIG